MKLKVIVREAEEGGFSVEVPAIPGCVTQGEALDDLIRNIQEVIEGCLSIDIPLLDGNAKSQILESAV